MAKDSKDAINSLVSKLETLELSDDEVAVLDALLSAAEESTEVEGFWELKRTRTERPDFGERPA